jgi:decaprenylphospho-beta-D-ribofuranose 2-oxidase
MNWKRVTLAGWGRTSTASMLAARPERVRDVQRALADVGSEGLIVHGGGRSYGDLALNDGGRVLLTERLNRVLSFDPETGDLVAEPGVTFAELLRLFLPRGFIVPVTPGTGFATLGGAVAADVHGKNHDWAGSFGDHVQWLDLLLPSGQVTRVSPEVKPDWFAATIGGLGLTGVITAVCVRLMSTPARAVTVSERRVADLDAMLAALEQHRATATFSVAWVDALARGRGLGRGIVEVAEPAPDAVPRDRDPRIRSVPRGVPGALLNPLSVRLFNRWYASRVPSEGRERAASFERFLYPLDAVRNWNRMYGRRGFFQFQCVLPEGAGPAGLEVLLETVAKARRASFLTVLKTMGREGRGHLSFARRGHTLALDFPRRSGADVLLAMLERVVLDHGGRVYLAKDAVLSRHGFAAMYPKLDRFRAALAEMDPEGRLVSDLARRLAVRERP